MNNKKKGTSKRQKNDFMSRVKNYLSDDKRLLSKYNLQSSLTLNFPRRKRVPLLSKIAMWVLRIQGCILDSQFNDLKQNRK